MKRINVIFLIIILIGISALLSSCEYVMLPPPEESQSSHGETIAEPKKHTARPVPPTLPPKPGEPSTKDTEKTIYIIHPDDLEEGDVRDLIPEVPTE